MKLSSEQVSSDWISLLHPWMCVYTGIHGVPARTHTHSHQHGMLAEDSSTPAWKCKYTMSGQPHYDIKNPPPKKKHPGKVARKGKRLLETAWERQSNSACAETIPEHQPGSPFFQGAPLPSKPRPAFAEARSLEIQALEWVVRKAAFLLLLCRPLRSISGQVFQPCLANANTKAGGCTASTHLLIYTHNTAHTYTYIPFTLHCVRPSQGGSRWTVCMHPGILVLFLIFPADQWEIWSATVIQHGCKWSLLPSQSSFLWLTRSSFYRKSSSSRKCLTQSSLQPFQLLKAATHLLPLPRRLAAPWSPRNGGSSSDPGALPPFQLPLHLPRHPQPRRLARPWGSCLLCLGCKESGSSSLAREILAPTPFPAPIGYESVSLARLLEWGGPSVACSGVYHPPGEIHL